MHAFAARDRRIDLDGAEADDVEVRGLVPFANDEFAFLNAAVFELPALDQEVDAFAFFLITQAFKQLRFREADFDGAGGVNLGDVVAGILGTLHHVEHVARHFVDDHGSGFGSVGDGEHARGAGPIREAGHFAEDEAVALADGLAPAVLGVARRLGGRRRALRLRLAVEQPIEPSWLDGRGFFPFVDPEFAGAREQERGAAVVAFAAEFAAFAGLNLDAANGSFIPLQISVRHGAEGIDLLRAADGAEVVEADASHLVGGEEAGVGGERRVRVLGNELGSVLPGLRLDAATERERAGGAGGHAFAALDAAGEEQVGVGLAVAAFARTHEGVEAETDARGVALARVADDLEGFDLRARPHAAIADDALVVIDHDRAGRVREAFVDEGIPFFPRGERVGSEIAILRWHRRGSERIQGNAAKLLGVRAVRIGVARFGVGHAVAAERCRGALEAFANRAHAEPAGYSFQFVLVALTFHVRLAIRFPGNRRGSVIRHQHLGEQAHRAIHVRTGLLGRLLVEFELLGR